MTFFDPSEAPISYQINKTGCFFLYVDDVVNISDATFNIIYIAFPKKLKVIFP